MFVGYYDGRRIFQYQIFDIQYFKYNILLFAEPKQTKFLFFKVKTKYRHLGEYTVEDTNARRIVYRAGIDKKGRVVEAY